MRDVRARSPIVAEDSRTVANLDRANWKQTGDPVTSAVRHLRGAGVKCVALGLLAMSGACRPSAAPPTESALTVARSALAASTLTISPEIGTDTPVLGPNPGLAQQPAAAFGQTSYLVVWSDQRTGEIDAPDGTTGADIYGIRVNPDGTVLDPASFPIAVAAGSQTSPQVAFDGTNWMVVWADSRDPSGHTGTYGARVATDGTLLDPQGIPLSPGTSVATANAPAGLDTDGTNVVMTTVRNDGIYASVLQSDGTVLGSPFQVAPVGGAAPSLSTARTIWCCTRRRRFRLRPPATAATFSPSGSRRRALSWERRSPF